MKNRTEDLAVFGGPALFTEKIHVGRPNIGSREYFFSELGRVLDDHWLTNDGRCVRTLEAQLGEYLGVKHCILMCNATVALEIAARALDLRGEVIVPSLTFVATAHALQWQQIKPVFCDVDPRTHNLDPARVEALITPATTGIVGVHLWGRPCPVEALTGIARSRGLKLMFDAAHAFGSTYRGRRVGGFGDAEVFSFHATKFFNTFEGGAVTTQDDALAQKIRLMRNFGFAGFDNVIYIGTNGKMSEASAAMGLATLRQVDAFIDTNRRNYQEYRRGLQGVACLKLLDYDEREQNNFQYIVFEYDEQAAGLSRDRLIKVLWGENIIARRYFYPGCHRMEPYRTLFPHAGKQLPETERIASRLLILPTGTGISVENIGKLCELIKWLLSRAAELSSRLPA